MNFFLLALACTGPERYRTSGYLPRTLAAATVAAYMLARSLLAYAPYRPARTCGTHLPLVNLTPHCHRATANARASLIRRRFAYCENVRKNRVVLPVVPDNMECPIVSHIAIDSFEFAAHRRRLSNFGSRLVRRRGVRTPTSLSFLTLPVS
jgi:hypothetical protein